MKFRELEIAGVLLIEPEPMKDQRGFFARTFCADTFAERGLNTCWLQHSLSHNERAGTLRGMHFQRAPHTEVKIVSCPVGKIYDVVIDLRPDSRTYGRWTAMELDGAGLKSLYIPAGCAHGFQTLEDHTDVLYLISTRYAPAYSAGVRWDDPVFGVEWPPTPERTISDRDRFWPTFDLGSPP